MKRTICCILLFFICLCTSVTNVTDGSITITTNGMVTIDADTIHVKVDIGGRFELHVKDVKGQSVLFTIGNGPAEFNFLTSAFKPGLYQISVRDIDNKIIYVQDFSM